MTAFRLVVFCSCAAVALAQNVVERAPVSGVLEPVTLPAEFAAQLVLESSDADFSLPDTMEARRVAAKLEAHITEMVDGWPWRPLHHVLGISGAETCFDHPDELFYSVSLALPFLTEKGRQSAVEFLNARLAETPPYGTNGLDRDRGRLRESYTVPESLRRTGRGNARSAFGVAAFAMYATRARPAATLLQNHWPAVRNRMKPLLAREETFEVHKRGDGSDEAERLNGDLAGLIAFARFARQQHDEVAMAGALSRVQQLAQLRVNLERVNPVILEKTNSASKRLHNYKLARYCALTHEIAQCLRGPERELAASRLRAFREERNGWYLALGDRFVGGENYTNPLHFGRAVFAGAALIEKLPAEELLRFIDVPTCKADFYFIEKCALALQAAAH